jgi:hypothetical protein
MWKCECRIELEVKGGKDGGGDSVKGIGGEKGISV